ncbi:hypothetical protein L1049_010931 [Liquidambar formosana]|uniref:Transposase MuDR plant domain-containing protein n=1 Tax=Liquidambar formosana TaxID=63359 RepID=A0AAP0RQH9_LIQFO
MLNTKTLSDDSNDVLSDYQSNNNEEGKFPTSDFDVDEKAKIPRNVGRKEYDQIVRDGNQVKLEVGSEFASAQHFRDVLKNFIIQEGFEVKREKNEKAKVTVVCKVEGCPWRIHASPADGGATFRIKTFQPEYSFVRLDKNVEANSTWIVEKLSKTLKTNLDVKLDSLQSELWETYGIECSKRRLYRAKNKSREKQEGNHGESYGKLSTYVEQVRKTNPGSIMKMQYEWMQSSVNPCVKRMFICFNAIQNGFQAGCRPFIVLDGFHLEGPHGGMLLSAVALDGNCGLYLLAFAIVKGETKANWSFFLHHLYTVLGNA